MGIWLGAPSNYQDIPKKETLDLRMAKVVGKNDKHISPNGGPFFMGIFIPWDRIRQQSP